MIVRLVDIGRHIDHPIIMSTSIRQKCDVNTGIVMSISMKYDECINML